MSALNFTSFVCMDAACAAILVKRVASTLTRGNAKLDKLVWAEMRSHMVDHERDHHTLHKLQHKPADVVAVIKPHCGRQAKRDDTGGPECTKNS